ncbi:hypothetical protein A2Y85_07600 [candidate division WOR-3 bacterium RBG_13_43_14]|uniref:Secretion system C-terminal sorting domain-containing protein n=1 Tax=candidate division WOR-3 bacterium RBG_13_43_14 TaxID=1802590 RepID=A0A1F4UF39_UNCW3|nr:MAG: hypothetical protein A2Y85_07600 [candidate division WOR-3 bacterium RBG_13_43_14]
MSAERVEAYAWPAYYPDTQLTSEIKCLQPITDFDFYLEQTGIFESNSDKNINSGLIYAYPNPVFDYLNIYLPKPQRFIDIYDITGAVRMRCRNQHLSNFLQIDLAGLSKGVYFILINETKLKILKL